MTVRYIEIGVRNQYVGVWVFCKNLFKATWLSAVWKEKRSRIAPVAGTPCHSHFCKRDWFRRQTLLQVREVFAPLGHFTLSCHPPSVQGPLQISHPSWTPLPFVLAFVLLDRVGVLPSLSLSVGFSCDDPFMQPWVRRVSSSAVLASLKASIRASPSLGIEPILWKISLPVSGAICGRMGSWTDKPTRLLSSSRWTR